MAANKFFQFLRNSDSCRIINLTTVALGLIVLFLVGTMMWRIYQSYQMADRIVQANELADRITVAASIQAMERGLTAAALGSPRESAGGIGMKQLQDLRSRGDSVWGEALNIAKTLASQLPSDSTYHDIFVDAMQYHLALQKMRQRVDQGLITGEREIIDEWVATITNFISAAARLRDAAFATAEGASDEISYLNIILRRNAWLIAEHTGLERGVLAFYVASRRPVPEETLDMLKAYRGVVERNLREFSTVRMLVETSPQYSDSVEILQKQFFGEFEKIRKKVYAGVRSGVYPLSVDEWWDEATEAVNAVLAVSGLVGNIASEKARILAVESLHQLIGYVVLSVVAILFVSGSIARVGRTANILARQKELAEVTLHSIGDAVITTNTLANIEYLNPLAEELTGWTNEEAQGKPLSQIFTIVNGLTREPDVSPVEKCLEKGLVVGLADNTVLINREGKEYVIEDSAAPIHDASGHIVGAVMVFYDVTAMRSAPHLLSYHATHDALTSLVNRREFERRLSESLLQAKGFNYQHALCYLDLDQFKIINDTCGHAVGDRLLHQLSHLLSYHLRESDTLGRLGGDEFGVLLHNCSLDQARQIGEKLCATVRGFHFNWGDQVFELGVSIGLVPVNAESKDIQEILSEADAACYVAKEKGRGRIQIFQHGDAELAKRHGDMQWVSRLNWALSEGRFLLYSQPIVSLSNSQECHYEILLRLKDENDDIVLPGAFIPAAERYNIMTNIDRWVIATAIGRLGYYLNCNQNIGSHIWSINISGASLGDNTMLSFIQEQMSIHRVPARLLCFEITETAAVENIDQARKFMKTFKESGCHFSLDDFGSGLSSFNYLKNLPVDYVKIDGAFVKGIANNPLDMALVRSINDIGHAIGTKTIAEFVDSRNVMDKLREIGVDYAQGFFIAEPDMMDTYFR